MRAISFGFCVAALALATTASAHHSTAAYDYSKEQVLEGTVTAFQWTNPHMFVKVMVKGSGNKQVVWNIECGTPNINIRHGWKSTDIKRGDRLSMKIAPMRDGTPAGTMYSVRLVDGRTLYGPAIDMRGGLPK
ncbi:hypothetical protein WSK_3324 [Novosphingobium sp. Rr 2-17]|uniref:DUF6152 family protein n=1 Tax=Novosphingobium sp. Rr 2-17 TaxID=555793 RepID=UPI0002699228|nr:DUF6152 family protein [Novosphingobium sp. Rr 2-17]EIZ78111.1 hypothetical protein WSK_3324 [Novosphingobium sp. Rr 2-17]